MKRDRIKILDTDYHRNGSFGAGFQVILFKDIEEKGTKLAILFDTPEHCAVLDIEKLTAGDIVSGSNSYRGDIFEPLLRKALETFGE